MANSKKHYNVYKPSDKNPSGLITIDLDNMTDGEWKYVEMLKKTGMDVKPMTKRSSKKASINKNNIFSFLDTEEEKKDCQELLDKDGFIKARSFVQYRVALKELANEEDKDALTKAYQQYGNLTESKKAINFKDMEKVKIDK